MRVYFWLLMVVCSLLLFSCTQNLEKKIITEYPNGLPKYVEIYESNDSTKNLVKQIRYYKNGEKEEEGEFLNGLKHGEWTYWYENGNVWSKGFFKNGLRDGKTQVYYENGNKHYSGFYTNSKSDKKWTFWNSEGKKTKEVIFDKGKIIEEKEFN